MNANPNPNVIDVTVENFQEVVEKSKQLPVLMEFYADDAEPSQQLAPILRKLANEYQGKFILARVNIQQSQPIVQQLGVRTLPTIKVIFQGKMVQDLEGPQEEQGLRKVLDQLTMSPIERIQEQIKMLLAEGDRDGAIQMLQQVIVEEPGNAGLKVELADLLVMESRIDEARQLLLLVPEETAGISKPRNRIIFIDKAVDLPSIAELKTVLESTPGNLMNRYHLAVRFVADDQIEAALEQLLEVLKKDREFEGQLARKTMIEVFGLLGKGDEIATVYRRRMFAFLH